MHHEASRQLCLVSPTFVTPPITGVTKSWWQRLGQQHGESHDAPGTILEDVIKVPLLAQAATVGALTAALAASAAPAPHSPVVVSADATTAALSDRLLESAPSRAADRGRWLLMPVYEQQPAPILLGHLSAVTAARKIRQTPMRPAAAVHAVTTAPVVRAVRVVAHRQVTSVARPALVRRLSVHRSAPARARQVTQARRVTPVTQAARTTRAGAGGGAVVAYAYAQLGKPYVFGAAGPNAYDCSGLTLRAYARVGRHLAHSAAAQTGAPVSTSAARPGDLVKWGSEHVGIYVGGGYVIHAPHPGRRIQKSRLWGSYRIVRVP